MADKAGLSDKERALIEAARRELAAATALQPDAATLPPGPGQPARDPARAAAHGHASPP